MYIFYRNRSIRFNTKETIYILFQSQVFYQMYLANVKWQKMLEWDAIFEQISKAHF